MSGGGRQLIFFFARRIDDGDLLAEDGNLVVCDFARRAVRRRDFAFLDRAVVADEELGNFALDGTGLRDGLRADDADVLVEQRFVVAGIVELEDVLAVRDGDGVVADGDDGFVRDELDAAVPVFILPFFASMSRVLLMPSSRPSVMLMIGRPRISTLFFI